MHFSYWGKIALAAVLAGVGLFLFVKNLEIRSLYYPTPLDGRTPRDAGFVYEDVHFQAEDGVPLHGWFVRVENARGNLLYCHGNAGNIADRIGKLKTFTDMRFNVFMFDYRGYGQSKGSPSEVGLYRDARAAFDHVVSRKDAGRLPVILYGSSLGGAVAVDLAVRRSPAVLVVEASFSSIRDLADLFFPWVPRFLVGVKFDSAAKAAGIRIPKLFMHSFADEIIPFRLGEKLFLAASEPKVFVRMDGGHNDDPFQSSPRILKEFQEFLAKNGL